ncbi:hypothetical protein BKA62DRAFT_669746 [Auriculariales sp. MPI-PUGE-AT-0066]|nr:hypothetical protein BKA62DRAFT_669746 [Auriculariales sp. MPI-PUGE-AT-0066]
MASTSRKRRAPAADILNEGLAVARDWYDYLDDDLPDLSATNRKGNWGNKLVPGAEWVRRGKIAAWGPGRDEWELEERARKRIKALLPPSRSPSPPVPMLSHMRAPSPPTVAPYSPPARQHGSFSAFVLDESVQHAFRASMLPDLQRASCNLIENEAELKRAFGRFWAVVSNPPASIIQQQEKDAQASQSLTNGHAHTNGNGTSATEDGDSPNQETFVKHEGEDDSTKLAATREDSAFPPPSRIFLVDQPSPTVNGHPLPVREQLEHIDKALATLRDMQDDGREYTERLIELREGLGDLGYQRHSIWNVVRERALKEMALELGR